MIDETKKGLGAEHLVDQDSTPKPVILPKEDKEQGEPVLKAIDSAKWLIDDFPSRPDGWIEVADGTLDVANAELEYIRTTYLETVAKKDKRIAELEYANTHAIIALASQKQRIAELESQMAALKTPGTELRSVIIKHIGNWAISKKRERLLEELSARENALKEEIERLKSTVKNLKDQLFGHDPRELDIVKLKADLGNTRRKFVIWHDGGEWFISLEGKELTNCKRLLDWLTGDAFEAKTSMKTRKMPELEAQLSDQKEVYGCTVGELKEEVERLKSRVESYRHANVSKAVRIQAMKDLYEDDMRSQKQYIDRLKADKAELIEDLKDALEDLLSYAPEATSSKRWAEARLAELRGCESKGCA